MTYSNEASELAYAWGTVSTPLDAIAEMHIQLQHKLEEEREHVKFLGDLLSALYGDGWRKLTIAKAERLRFIGDDA